MPATIGRSYPRRADSRMRHGQCGVDVSARRVTILFDDDPPYTLAGQWVPYIVVVLTTSLGLQRGAQAVCDALAL